MKKTSIVAGFVIGIVTLATGTYALAAGTNPAPGSVVKTNGPGVTMIPATSDTLHLHFAGAEIVTRELPGELMIVKARGRLMYYRPDAYQMIEGELTPVAVEFRIEGKDDAIARFSKVDKNAPVFLKGGAVMSDPREKM